MKKTRKPSELGRKAERALQSAVAEVVKEHRRLGLPLAVMHNGKAVLATPTRTGHLQVKESRPSYRKRKTKKKR